MLRPPTIQPPNRRAPTVPPPGMSASRDEAATTQPAMPAMKASDLAAVSDFHRSRTDAAVTRPVPLQDPLEPESAATQPAMPRAGDDTQPALELPMPTDPSSPWSRGLAARVDAHLDDDFGRDTPVKAPTRAELQALVDTPPDATRQQSIEEIERLQRDPAARRSEEELQFVAPRRAFPTAEVSEEDIEAAIEIVPAARRTGQVPIGVAKKKSPSE
jgi:hypothetical protein